MVKNVLKGSLFSDNPFFWIIAKVKGLMPFTGRHFLGQTSFVMINLLMHSP